MLRFAYFLHFSGLLLQVMLTGIIQGGGVQCDCRDCRGLQVPQLAQKSILCHHEVVFLTCIFTGKWETTVGFFFVEVLWCEDICKLGERHNLFWNYILVWVLNVLRLSMCLHLRSMRVAQIDIQVISFSLRMASACVIF